MAYHGAYYYGNCKVLLFEFCPAQNPDEYRHAQVEHPLNLHCPKRPVDAVAYIMASQNVEVIYENPETQEISHNVHIGIEHTVLFRGHIGRLCNF